MNLFWLTLAVFIGICIGWIARIVNERRHGHHYLSTACLHGQHERCGGKQRSRGDLGPPRCKFCPAVCACPTCRHGARP